jgi:hypothetical protein
MEKTPKGWFQGKIPKKVVTGKSVQFYFEGRNNAGRPVVSNGRADSPNLMLIREEEVAEEAEKAAPKLKKRKGVPAEEDENPLEDNERSGPRLYLGKVDKSKIGLDTRFGKRKWWIMVGAGVGYGYASGNLEARPDLQSAFAPGLAFSGLMHFAPEVGYQVTPDFAVAIQGRNQIILQPPEWSKFTAHGAQSILLRALLFTRQQRLRFYGSGMAGGGEGFRFTLFPDSSTGVNGGPSRTNFQDTIRGGPILAGLGGGLYYEASSPVSIVLEVNALAGFPDFSVVADVNFGLQINIY